MRYRDTQYRGFEITEQVYANLLDDTIVEALEDLTI